jgi:hypothetical protein
MPRRACSTSRRPSEATPRYCSPAKRRFSPEHCLSSQAAAGDRFAGSRQSERPASGDRLAGIVEPARQSACDSDPDLHATRTLLLPDTGDSRISPAHRVPCNGGQLSASDGRPRGSSRARLPMLFDTEGPTSSSRLRRREARLYRIPFRIKCRARRTLLLPRTGVYRYRRLGPRVVDRPAADRLA